MRNPNGYGSVVYLGKNRRKPYAVRVTNGYKEVNGRFRQQYKYLGYFEKSKEANMFLANYNSGMPVKEHTSLIKEPTFKEVYESWLEYKKSRKKPPTASTIRNYNLAYNRFSDVKDRKIKNIQTDDIQKIADKVSEKSNSTMVLTKTVLSQVYEYAMKRKYVDINIADLCDWDYTTMPFFPSLRDITEKGINTCFPTQKAALTIIPCSEIPSGRILLRN